MNMWVELGWKFPSLPQIEPGCAGSLNKLYHIFHAPSLLHFPQPCAVAEVAQGSASSVCGGAQWRRQRITQATAAKRSASGGDTQRGQRGETASTSGGKTARQRHRLGFYWVQGFFFVFGPRHGLRRPMDRPIQPFDRRIAILATLLIALEKG